MKKRNKLKSLLLAFSTMMLTSCYFTIKIGDQVIEIGTPDEPPHPDTTDDNGDKPNTDNGDKPNTDNGDKPNGDNGDNGDKPNEDVPEGLKSVTFDSSFKPSINDKKSKLTKYNTTYTYSNVEANSDGHVIIDRAGYIRNETPLVDVKSISINYSIIQAENSLDQIKYGYGNLYFIQDEYFIDNPLSFKGVEIIETNGQNYKITNIDSKSQYFAFYGFNTFDIKSIVIEYNGGTATYQNEEFSLDIISTNDMHGQAFDNGTSSSGLRHIASKINDLKNQYKYSLLLDQGDIYQGTIDSYMTDGHLMDDFFISSGFDATAVGNHEWDYGFSNNNGNGIQDHIEYYKYTNFDILSNNILLNNKEPSWAHTINDKDGNPLYGCKMVERHGVKIGLIGMAGNYYTSISGSKFIGYSIESSKEKMTKRLKAASNALKGLGADFVIMQYHEGNTNYDTSLSSEGYINLCLEGHTHNAYRNQDSGGVYHVQNGGYNAGITNTVVNFKFVDGKWTASVQEPTYTNASKMNKLAEDKLMSDIYDFYFDNVFGYPKNQIVATTNNINTSDGIADVNAQVYYDAGIKEWGTQYDIVYGGGFIKTRTPYSLSSAVVTYGDVNTLFPFDNDIMLCKSSWKSFLSNFYNAGGEYHGYSPDITYVDSVYYYKGNPINESDICYYVTDSYSYDYYTYTKQVTGFELVDNYTAKHKQYARDLIVEYLSDHFLGTSAVPPTISFENSTFNIKTKESKTLSITTNQGNASCIFSTSDNEIVSIDSLTGNVKGLKAGEATITAISLLDKNVKTTCKVVVSNEEYTGNGNNNDDLTFITVEEALAQCATLGSGQYSSSKVNVKGIIKSIQYTPNANYPTFTFYIGDSSNSLYVYSMRNINGTDFDVSDASLLKVGDEVIVNGYLQNYKGTTYELTYRSGDYCTLVSVIH